MTASGTLPGNNAEKGSTGYTKVVGAVGHRPGEGQGEGNGNGIGVRLRVRHGGGGGAGNRKQGKQLKWGRMEQSKCGRMGMKATQITYYIEQSLVTG